MAAGPTPRAPGNAQSKQTDPVGELRFKLELTTPSGTIGRFQEVTGLAAELEVKEYPEGGMNDYVHKLPTRVKWPNVVLKRGVTVESQLLKWFWATRVSASEKNLVSVELILQGPGGEKVRTFALKEAFPVKWTGPTFNAGSNSIATEQLEIAHHGLAQIT